MQFNLHSMSAQNFVMWKLRLIAIMIALDGDLDLKASGVNFGFLKELFYQFL